MLLLRQRAKAKPKAKTRAEKFEKFENQNNINVLRWNMLC